MHKLTICLALVACCTAEPVEPYATHALQTSDGEYRLSDNGIGDYDLTIAWAYKNSGGATTYHHPCSSRLEKSVNNSWVVAYRRVCPTVAQAIDTIAPGETLAGTFEIHACYQQNCFPRFEVDPIPGTYRIVAGFYSKVLIQAGSAIPQDSLPTIARRSNSFLIALP